MPSFPHISLLFRLSQFAFSIYGGRCLGLPVMCHGLLLAHIFLSFWGLACPHRIALRLRSETGDVEKRSTRGISGTTYVPTQRGISSIPVLLDDRIHTKMKADLSAALYRVWFFGLQRCPVVTFPFYYYRLPGCLYGVLQSMLATVEFFSISDLQRLPRSRQISSSISTPSSELQTQLHHNLRL
jgi:hypothetical protein